MGVQSQETAEHLNYMRVCVSVVACLFLLRVESDYKPRCNSTGLNCYVELLGPYTSNSIELTRSLSVFSQPR